MSGRARTVVTALALVVVASAACGAPAADAPREPLRIGAVYPLSGTQGPGGVEEFEGVRTAVALVNADGGVDGRRVELVPVDVPASDAAPEAIEDLDRAGIRFVLGSYGSTISAPAAEAAAARGMLFWETGAVGEMDEAAGRGLVFRVAPSGAVLGRNAIAFVADAYAPIAGVDPSDLRFAVTLVDDAYGRAVARGALEEIAARGFGLVAELAYDPLDVAMDDLVRRLARAEPDVLFVSAYLDDAIAMRREIVAQRLDVLVGIGTSSSYCMPEFGDALGTEAVGLFASDKPDAASVDVDGLLPEGRALLERARAAYGARFDGPMSAAALAGFSGAWALLHDVAPRASTLTPEGVADAANDVSRPIGSLPNGSGLRFGEPGTALAGANVLASSVVWQWQSPGENAVVWPDRYATSPIGMLDPLP